MEMCRIVMHKTDKYSLHVLLITTTKILSKQGSFVQLNIQLHVQKRLLSVFQLRSLCNY